MRLLEKMVKTLSIEAALPTLATNARVPAFLFMTNNAEDPQSMIDALGRERVVMGFPSAGGAREGPVVTLMEAKGKGVTVGELDGSKSERLQRIMAAFRAAGFPVEFSRNIDAWLRCHVALVAPMATAMYMTGSLNNTSEIFSRFGRILHEAACEEKIRSCEEDRVRKAGKINPGVDYFSVMD